MIFSNVVDRGSTPALVAVMAFSEARLRTIAENIANAETPGYRGQHLDRQAFQASLKEALAARKRDQNRAFVIEKNPQVRTTDTGVLAFTPSEKPVRNVLFHDGTNVSLEREMSDLAETGMAHELAAALLRGRFDGLRKAIRGTVG